MKKLIFSFLFMTSIFFIFINSINCDETPVIGIVLSVSQKVYQNVQDKMIELKSGSEIIRDGSLILPENQRKGKILIGTDAGPVLFTRFPVAIEKKIKTPLTHTLMTNYLACIGGEVLTAKGIKNETTPSELFRLMVESLVKKPGGKPLVVTMGNFVYADKGIGSEFSTFIESQLSIAITESDFFELFAKNHLEEILEMQELSISDLCAGKDVRIGELASIDALMYGQFYDDDNEILIFLSLINIETGLISGTTSFPLNKKYLPSSLSILPSNAENALTIIEDLAQVGTSADNSLTIKAWPTRGLGGRYYKDEELIVKFQANMNCYIKIYHIDVNKKMSLIFPNKYHKSNKLKKESIYTIPEESYEFAFILGKPFGTEFIKIIASTTQFEDIEEAFEFLGEGDPEIIGKGISLEQREGKLAEVLFSYTILDTPGNEVKTK